jgi:hypothetical protein
MNGEYKKDLEGRFRSIVESMFKHLPKEAKEITKISVRVPDNSTQVRAICSQNTCLKLYRYCNALGRNREVIQCEISGSHGGEYEV